jgi:hypothetical protein
VRAANATIIEEEEWGSEDNFWPATSSYSIPGVAFDLQHKSADDIA